MSGTTDIRRALTAGCAVLRIAGPATGAFGAPPEDLHRHSAGSSCLTCGLHRRLTQLCSGRADIHLGYGLTVRPDTLKQLRRKSKSNLQARRAIRFTEGGGSGCLLPTASQCAKVVFAKENNRRIFDGAANFHQLLVFVVFEFSEFALDFIKLANNIIVQ